MLDVHLRHDFDGFSLDAAFQAPAGVTALFGHSGAGKTSIVKAISGILKVNEARVSVGETVLEDSSANLRLPVHKRRIGYVFQEPRLFPHMSVKANLHYGMRGGDFDQVVSMLGIAPLLTRRPGALSGGEAQRVAIGRALLSNPRLLLLDEPLAALDEARKAEILPYIERLRDTGIPILYVSHSVPEIARLATTIVALEAGRVLRAGPAADILSDLDLVPALGVRDAGAILTARVVSHHDDGLSELATSSGTLWLPRMSAAPGTALRVRIEAQDVMLSKSAPGNISALNILPVTIQSLRKGEGPGVIARMTTGQDYLLARVTRRSAESMELSEGWQGYAVVKSVAVASGDVSTG